VRILGCKFHFPEDEALKKISDAKDIREGVSSVISWDKSKSSLRFMKSAVFYFEQTAVELPAGPYRFKGVTFVRGKWRGTGYIDGKQRMFASANTEEECARLVRSKAAVLRAEGKRIHNTYGTPRKPKIQKKVPKKRKRSKDGEGTKKRKKFTTVHIPDRFKKKSNRYVSIKKLKRFPTPGDRCDCNDRGEICADNCANRGAQMECPPECECGDLCQNRRFQLRQWKKVVVKDCGDKGWGLFADENIVEGEFVIEYVGELINDKEQLKRSKKGPMNYLFQIKPKLFIDASRYGNAARFVNHSCEPNCFCSNWTVGDEPVVGVFAERDIKKGEELTFLYNWSDQQSWEFNCCCKKCQSASKSKSKFVRTQSNVNKKVSLDGMCDCCYDEGIPKPSMYKGITFRSIRKAYVAQSWVIDKNVSKHTWFGKDHCQHQLAKIVQKKKVALMANGYKVKTEFGQRE